MSNPGHDVRCYAKPQCIIGTLLTPCFHNPDFDTCIQHEFNWSSVIKSTYSPPSCAATHTDSLSPPVIFSCGVAAGLLASISTQPADVVKTSVQVRAANTGLVETVFNICQRTGLRGMFVGILPRATRRTLMAAFTWSFYEQVRICCFSPLPPPFLFPSPPFLMHVDILPLSSPLSSHPHRLFSLLTTDSTDSNISQTPPPSSAGVEGKFY